MIKDVRKANSDSILKAELRAFNTLQKYTTQWDSEHSFIGDKVYERLRDEWNHLLHECSRRKLPLLGVK